MKKSCWTAIGILVACAVVAGIVCGLSSRKKTNAKAIQLPGGVVLEMQLIPSGLWFGKYEVTQAQWEAVMDDNPSAIKNPDNPVERVSWDDCQEFLKKLNSLPSVKKSGLMFRLPTKEEWEYACRAGAMDDYSLLADGTEITRITLDQVAWFYNNSDGMTHPVGQKKPNAFGLYDMHGNVREWTSTADGEGRVLRGGGWVDWTPDCESSNQRKNSPSFRRCDLGFRLCASGGSDGVAAIKSVARGGEVSGTKRDENSPSAASNPVIAELCAGMVQIPGKDYKMGKFEVTQVQWEEVMHENPSLFKNPDNPVENVSWDDCKEFLRKLNSLPSVKKSGLTFRLPTKEEWEYSCRAGATGDYSLLADGTEISENTLGQVAWFGEDRLTGSTHPVGQKKPNAFGLYDMHGNVWEWTSTAFVEDRVLRGGGWVDWTPDCESSNLSWISPTHRSDNLGFRLCASGGAD